MLRKILNRYFLFIKKRPKKNLLILDDLTPSLRSPWRSYEFENYLRQVENVQIVSEIIPKLSELEFKEEVESIRPYYPLIGANVLQLKLFTNINYKLAYCLFFNNIKKYYPYFKLHNIHFGFALYPGGGFGFNNKEIDEIVSKVLNDNLCKFVIVNQEITKNYLIEKLGISSSKIHFFLGVPLKIDESTAMISYEQKYFFSDKKEIDVVFMGNKYTRSGADKGFDVFQNVALELFDHKQINFHVVGGFGEPDLLYNELKGRLVFYGNLSENKLSHFFSDKDIFISPNRPYIINQNAFDGFPLATSVAAGLNGCLVFQTNMLNESKHIFADGREYIEISINHKEVAHKILHALTDKQKIRQIIQNNKVRLTEVFSDKQQIQPRIEIIKKFI